MTSLTRPARCGSSNLLCLAGMILMSGAVFIGSMFAVTKWQIALSMKGEPSETTLTQLIQDGPGDNAHIRLRSIAIDSEVDIFETGVRKRGRTMCQGFYAKLYPLGQRGDEFQPAVVVHARSKEKIEQYVGQVAAGGELIGRVRPMASTYDIPTALCEWALTDIHDGQIWVIEPNVEIGSVVEAQQHTLVAICVLVLGIMLSSCGTGRIGLGNWGGALLSRLARPLRGKCVTRRAVLAYITLGFSLVFGSAYYLSTLNFGSVVFTPWSVIGAGMGISLGIASVTGAMLAAVRRRLAVSASRRRSKLIDSTSAETVESLEVETRAAALVSGQVEEQSPQYLDSDYQPTFELSSSMERMQAAISHVIEPVGFVSAGKWKVRTPVDSYQAFAFAGCSGLVGVEMRLTNNQPSVWMVSVLNNGVAVVTTDCNVDIGRIPMSANCVAHSLPGTELRALLGIHLDHASETSQKQGEDIAEFDASEILDLILYGQRALANMQFDYGRSTLEVQPASYDRFTYPTGPSWAMQPSDVRETSMA